MLGFVGLSRGGRQCRGAHTVWWMQGFRVVRVVSTPRVVFAESSSVSVPYVAAATLPRATCRRGGCGFSATGSLPAHLSSGPQPAAHCTDVQLSTGELLWASSQAPRSVLDPGCRCGFHGFWSFDDAVEYAEMLGGGRWSGQFLVACFRPAEFFAGSEQFRAVSGTYLSVAVPEFCWCGARARTVARLDAERAAAMLDPLAGEHARFGWGTFAASCSRHAASTADMLALAGLVPVSDGTSRARSRHR